MDLVALMLEQGLEQFHGSLEAKRLCPPMRRRLSRPNHTHRKLMFNADRIFNRLWDYPRWLESHRDRFDLFHVVDHSYSQLVHHLPADRTVVTCHDLDAFRSVLTPVQEKRSFAFRTMTRRILTGLQKAARITCPSVATKDEIVAHGLVDPGRISVISNGVHPSCSPKPDPVADREAAQVLGGCRPHDLLHVGTTVPRKRIHVLLETLAEVRRQIPDARLIRVGGPFTPDQAALARRLRITDSIVVLPRLERRVLASVYRHAGLSLLPSEREGFGLPLAESMACGTPVIATDLQVLREVGGDAAEYCAVGNTGEWAETAARLLIERASDPALWRSRRERSIRQASHFSWAEHARRMAMVYSQVLR